MKRGIRRNRFLFNALLTVILGLIFSLALLAPWWAGPAHAQEPTATTVSPTDTPEATEAPAPTTSPTETPTEVPTETPSPTEMATATSPPTDTPMPLPTDTPLPTETVTATATSVPVETATATSLPTDTPMPLPTDTPLPTETSAAVPTATGAATPTLTTTPTTVVTSIEIIGQIRHATRRMLLVDTAQGVKRITLTDQAIVRRGEQVLDPAQLQRGEQVTCLVSMDAAGAWNADSIVAEPSDASGSTIIQRGVQSPVESGLLPTEEQVTTLTAGNVPTASPAESFALSGLSSASASSSTGWLLPHYDTQNSRWKQDEPGGVITPTLLWEHIGTGVQFQELVADTDTVYYSQQDWWGWVGYNAVVALDQSTGAIRWTFPLANDPSGGALAEGRFYFGDQDGYIYALDAATGTVIWQTSTSAYFEYAPAVQDGKVYIVSDWYGVYCLDAATGAILWHNQLFDEAGGQYGSMRCTPAVVNGVVYVTMYFYDGSTDYGRLAALDATIGDFLWDYRHTFDGYGSSYMSPLVADGKVFFGTEDGGGEGSYYALQAVDIASHELAWSYRFSGNDYWTRIDYSAQPLAYANGRLIATPGEHVYCFEADSGAVLWTFALPWADWPSKFDFGAMIAGDKVIVPFGDEPAHQSWSLYVLSLADGSVESVYVFPVRSLVTPSGQTLTQGPGSFGTLNNGVVFLASNCSYGGSSGSGLSSSFWAVSLLEEAPGLWVDLEVSTNTLTTTSEGWPAPNPLVITVTVGNDTDFTVNDLEVNFELESFFVEPRPRFYIASDEAWHEEQEKFSVDSYTKTVAIESLEVGGRRPVTWTVWIQPSETAVLNCYAELASGPPGYVGINSSAQVYIEEANIHPVVFLHGILGSMPPHNNVVTLWPQNWGHLDPDILTQTYLDPFIDSYNPLIKNLMKMGYELDKTLIPVTYDWRNSNRESAAWLKHVLADKVGANGVPVQGLPSYVNPDAKADVVVHSMGGLVLRSYIAGLATENGTIVGYDDNVRKTIFIATPHRGFPATYRTREELMWIEYATSEVYDIIGGADMSWWTQIPNDTVMRYLMDHLLWPAFILKKYDPHPFEPCYVSPAYWIPKPPGAPQYLIEKFNWLIQTEYDQEIMEALERHFGVDLPLSARENWRLLTSGITCPSTVLYDYSHHYARGIQSLPEMLPPVSDDPPGAPPPVYPEAASAAIQPYLIDIADATNYYPYDRQINPLLEWPFGLNSANRVGVFSDTIGLDNIYVIYGMDVPDTVQAFHVDPPPIVEPWCLNFDAWYFEGRRINGSIVGQDTDDQGDNLIPEYSTRLRDDGEGLLPDLPASHEIEVNDPNDNPGHKGIVFSKRTQKAIGWALTDIGRDQQGNFTFPLITDYITPTMVLNNVDAVLDILLVWSPVDVMVTDPQGRRLGYDPTTGQVVSEIPQGFYSGPGADEEFFLLPPASGGDYTITATGAGSGPYTISMHRFEAGQPILLLGVVGGETQPGQVQTHTVPSTPPTPPPDIHLLPFVDVLDALTHWTTTGTWTADTADPHAGTHSWMTAEDGASLILTDPLDAGDAARPTLSFWTRWTLPAGNAGYVEISGDDGQTWTTVYTQTTQAAAWMRVEAPLENLAGQQFRLRLRLSAPLPAGSGQAWWVDDLLVLDLTPPVIHPVPFSDGFETDDNWNSLQGWTTTGDAHTGVVAQFAADDEATLQLVDAVDLTEANQPTLTFWEKFTAPPGSQALVFASDDGGLHWTPVYTQTVTATDWEPVTVDLSQFTGKQVQLAFFLEKSEGQTVSSENVPVADSLSAEQPQKTADATPLSLFGGLTIPAILLTVRAGQGKRRPKGSRTLLRLIPIVVVLLACGGCAWVGWRLFVYPATPAGQKAHVEGRRDRADEIDQVTGGRVEVVVSADTGVGGGRLSPDGRWLIWGTAQARADIPETGRYLLNLETGEQFELSQESLGTWVNEEYLAYGQFLLRVPDLSVRKLELVPEDRIIETFENAKDVYVLDGLGSWSGKVFLSTDPGTPYIVFEDTSKLGLAVKNNTLPLTYTVVAKPVDSSNSQYVSPDGNLIALYADIPETLNQGRFKYLSIRTPDGREVASVYKKAWNPHVMGWGPDSRTLYFYEATLGAASGIHWPERPVHKLIVDYPPATTTPSGEGRGLGLAQLLPVSYRPAQAGAESGWYIDDVLVQDVGAPTPTATPTNTPTPTLTVDAGPDQMADEGDEVSFSGTVTDGLNTYTVEWDFGDGATASGTLTPTHTYADNGLYTVTLTVSVNGGAVGSDTLLVTVDNVAPAVGLITAPMDPLAVNNTTTASATFTDPGLLDTHTALWDWGDGNTSPGIVEETGGSGTVTGTHTYTMTGVYTARLTVTDDDGDSDESAFRYIVVYDPEGGFVTGGGWIQSPEGAYTLDPSLTGKANFGFVSKYKKGANVPTGNTQFQFKVADLKFHSDTYQWLVVSGARARYKGVGVINGEGEYKFLLTAVDADINPNDSIGVDRFRIKIWVEDDQGNETVVYDNGLGAEDYPDDPTVGTTEIGGGSIVIHQE